MLKTVYFILEIVYSCHCPGMGMDTQGQIAHFATTHRTPEECNSALFAIEKGAKAQGAPIYSLSCKPVVVDTK